jgi:hypothetical protein
MVRNAAITEPRRELVTTICFASNAIHIRMASSRDANSRIADMLARDVVGLGIHIQANCAARLRHMRFAFRD